MRSTRSPGRTSPWHLAAAALAGWVAWQLSQVLLLAFAGILLALALRSGVLPLKRRTGWSERVSLAVLVLGLTALLALGAWLAGAALVDQLETLRQTVPQALAKSRLWLADFVLGRWLLGVWQMVQLGPEDAARLLSFATGTLNVTMAVVTAGGAVVLLVALGIYLAADPFTYRDGFLQLLPERQRARFHRLLGAAGDDLRRWLLAQGVSMLVVGALMGIGLAAIGTPLALALAIIAGVFEFVPYFGTLISSLLVIIVAFSDSADQALRAGAVCFAVQQIEAYVLQPMVQRWAVRLPPALSLIAVLLFGVLLGLPGVLLASPLLVVTIAIARQALRERDRRSRLATVR